MKPVLIAFMMALLVWPGVVFAAGEADLAGTLEIGVRGVNQNGDSARFLEYRDLDDGTFANLRLDAYRDGYHLDLKGQNLGLSDQNYEMKGGRFGAFKYSIYYDELPHNLSFSARTFYAGIGSGALNYFATDRAKNTDAVFTPNVTTDPALWTEFDYALDRKTYGGEVEVSFGTPFYLTLKAEQVETEGVKPLGSPSGVVVDITGPQFSPFGSVVEMPEPVDYKTSNLTVETGYLTRDLTVALTGFLSTFENSDEFLSWRNPYVTTDELSEVNSLAPDNDYYKISGQVTKRLPLHSLLALRASHSKLESEVDLLSTIATDNHPDFSGNSPVYSLTTLGLSRNEFEGDVTYTTASVALISRPTRDLDVKVHYDYLDKNNDSSIVEFTNGTDSVENHIFDYDKHLAGIDVGYRLPKRTKATAGYEFKRVDRQREDADSTTDHKAYVQLKNSYLDFLTAKVKYQRLVRSSDFDNGTAGTDLTDDASIQRFVRRYDATHKNQDMVKVGLEFYPIEHLDLGLEYAYKRDDYDETELGRTDEESHEIYLDAAYEVPERVRLSGFVGYEVVSSEADLRQFNPGDITDPAAGTAGTAFNWSQELESDYWSYGLTAEVPLIKKKLDLVASWKYQDSDGENKFSTEGASAFENIDESDDYTLKTLDIKTVYTWSENLKLALGYLYEKFEYDDAQVDGYSNFQSALFNSVFLSGAYTDNDYEANIAYLTASYHF